MINDKININNSLLSYIYVNLCIKYWVHFNKNNFEIYCDEEGCI